MARMSKYFMMAVLCFCISIGVAQAKDLKVSLGIAPPLVETKDKGILVDLLKAMAEEYKDGAVTWEVYPNNRSISNVESGKADLHLPWIDNPKETNTKMQPISEALFKVVFVLYTNKANKEINTTNFTKFRIETLQGGESSWGFKMTPSELDSGLKKVDLGRIDGYIMAMVEGDAVVKSLGLKNIKRWHLADFNFVALTTKDERGKEVDKVFSGIIKKLKANGKYQKIMGPLLSMKYDDWQM
jgi:polar amino acid transport system substrate-binding protein